MNARSVSSPFVSDLLTQAINVKASYYAYTKIEKLREQLLNSNKTINRLDLGATKQTHSKKKVGLIAKNSAKSPLQAQLLFRLVNYFQPSNILELGTSLGISTAYLASANTKTKVVTVEGCPETAKAAQQNFKHLRLKNINALVGDFDVVLPKVLNGYQQLDFVFFDGNHRKAATLNYFYQCLAKAHNNSVFVVDDIYWSGEMMEAWEEIKHNKKVTVSIDLFFMGIVFFSKEQEEQHFLIRF